MYVLNQICRTQQLDAYAKPSHVCRNFLVKPPAIDTDKPHKKRTVDQKSTEHQITGSVTQPATALRDAARDASAWVGNSVFRKKAVLGKQGGTVKEAAAISHLDGAVFKDIRAEL